MKKKFLIFAAIAALCFCLALILPGRSIMVITLPFRWAGRGLRLLSLTGGFGNLAAIVLFILAGALPLLLALGKKWSAENWLLPLSCGTLLYALYYMINPGLRPPLLQGDVGTLILCGCFYSLLLSWGVIRLLRSSDTMDTSGIYRTLRIFLWICAVECVWIGLPGGFSRLTEALTTLRAQNTVPGQNLFPTQLLLVISFLVTALEYALDAWAMYLAILLLQQIELDPYADSCCLAAEKAVRFCKAALVTIVLSHTVLNLGKMFAARLLLTLDASFRLPILSMAIVFAILGVSRLLRRGKQLKDDNELFI